MGEQSGQAGDFETMLPDLRGIPLEEMAGDPGITEAALRYLPQLQADVPVSSFNSSI